MTAEATGAVVALSLASAAFLAIVGLIAAVRELERSRDELIELDVSGR
jgi:HAMP domain-containing protein